ncbi:MAG: nucleotide exchange factor GrpE [Ktedonobacterales bacterium]
MAEPNDTEQEQREQQTIEADMTPDSAAPPSTEGAATGDLAAQLQAAREEAAQYKDKYLRGLADMDNFRKRQERIASDRTQRAQRELLEKVLEVMDNLDRAMHYQDTMDRESLQQGLRMVQWQLNELLKNEGLSPVPTVGEPFDPRVHEAIESVTSADHPEGTVVEEVRKGYMMGDNTLRPARVKVSGGSGA